MSIELKNLTPLKTCLFREEFKEEIRKINSYLFYPHFDNLNSQRNHGHGKTKKIYCALFLLTLIRVRVFVSASKLLTLKARSFSKHVVLGTMSLSIALSVNQFKEPYD